MYERLKPLVKWPDHEQLPMEFRQNKFSKCIVIIDCFEVFMERPKGLMVRAQTWSNYKHNKIPNRNISSGIDHICIQRMGWSCVRSENCGILDHLLPGDIILADYTRLPSKPDDSVVVVDEQETCAQEVWCYCQKGECGEMIKRESGHCEIDWFHTDCLKITRIPKGKWLCPECRKKVCTRRSWFVLCRSQASPFHQRQKATQSL